MSNDVVRRINLGAVVCEPRPQLPDGFRRSSTRVGAALGAARSGLSVYELPPGQAVSPYHYEEPEEEWLLVISGAPTLRHPNGEEQLEPWDIVFFPSGPAGAHLVRNNSDETARVAMFSSSGATVGAVVYPDSDLVWVWTADDAVDMVVERSSKVDDIAPWIADSNATGAEK
jgi:uncharacterized cupin superfamily protein